MTTVTIDDVRSWAPCYDPGRYLPEGWQGTALDILAVQECPAVDRLWVVLREECVSSRTLRLFAVWCARQALALVSTPDPRSVAACDVAERFANGEATQDELAAAWDAALAAVMDAEAAAKAAGAASQAAAKAAGAAYQAVAGDAFMNTAWAAAWDARLAAQAAAGDAFRAAAWAAAWYAAGDAQVEHLRVMLT